MNRHEHGVAIYECDVLLNVSSMQTSSITDFSVPMLINKKFCSRDVVHHRQKSLQRRRGWRRIYLIRATLIMNSGKTFSHVEGLGPDGAGWGS